MKYLAYIITIFLLRLLASMPKSILYLNADVLSFILHYIARYRKNVIRNNLRSSFPKASEKEIKTLIRKFYKHLADVIVENGVIQFYSKKRLQKMFSFSNPEVINKYYEQGRDIILITGHYNNWEWSATLSYTFDHLVVIVYRPLTNKYFNRKINNSRTRFGAAVVPMGNIGRALFEYKDQGIPTLTGMAGDQRPGWRNVQYWTEFLGQKTAVLTGSEKLAKKIDAVVVFMKVRRKSRGVYSAEIELITDKPKETEPNEITEKQAKILEKLILEEPANWLWSHRRWKFTYEQWKELKGI
ncbi:lysophospholipid acyltransferase family protein [Bacteroidota bacterium]